uniref:Glycoside hydrolase n=1 Tax=Steinernema glaseri TaxID=37863 RepID=A0A1I8ALR1_9BILA
MKYLIILTVAAIAFQSTLATKGIDAIDSISTNNFKCLQKEGYSFFVGRLWTSLGHPDLTGMKNIKNAHAAGISNVDAYFFPCLRSSCGSAASQIEKAVNKMNEEGVSIGTLWLDVERLAWPASHTSNRQFIKDMVKKAKAIVGATWSELSYLPLWWADYNGHDNFSGFKTFGGWTKPKMHQYAGNVKTSCGINVDVSWY